MIRLGLRFTVGGGKEGAIQLIATTVAVALGVGLLLTTLSGINAVNSQNARYAWLATGYSNDAPAATDASMRDPLWWRLKPDPFRDETVGRVDVAATGPDSPVPPGISELPRPGEYYASPAMAELIDSTPAAELGDRYPGEQVGTIGPEALPAPDSLIIVVGHTADELAQVSDAVQVSAIETRPPSSCSGDCLPIGVNADAMALILAVVAGALLFPILIFIGTATRLAAARREQRFAAMRLVGATPRQVSRISAVESILVAAAGVLAGLVVFFLLRGQVAEIPFTSARFYASDLTLEPGQILLVAVGVPIAGALASLLALRRVQISPLGVNRRTTPSRPRVWRLVPLLAGLAELAAVVAVGRPDTTAQQIQAFAPGFLLIMAGLLLAGPWLTLAGSRLMSRRTSRPAALIAGARLSDNPKAGFRSISGLVLALFVSSVAVGVISTVVAEQGTASGEEEAAATLVQQALERESLAPIPDPVLAGLRSIDGVEKVTLIHANPIDEFVTIGDRGVPAGSVLCSELAGTVALGSCEADAEVASIPLIALNLSDLPVDDVSWPAVEISPEEMRDLPLAAVAVTTDGSTSAIELARTTLGATYPDMRRPTTVADFGAEEQRTLSAWRQLANVVVAMSLVIAGCGLAVSVAAGVLDRKRPFSLLRLTGVPLGVLRRVVLLESAVPLLAVSVLSAVTGFVAAHLFLRVQLDYSLRPPSLEYYVVVAASLVASIAVIASTFPLLTRATGPETARNE